MAIDTTVFYEIATDDGSQHYLQKNPNGENLIVTTVKPQDGSQLFKFEDASIQNGNQLWRIKQGEGFLHVNGFEYGTEVLLNPISSTLFIVDGDTELVSIEFVNPSDYTPTGFYLEVFYTGVNAGALTVQPAPKKWKFTRVNSRIPL